MRNYLIKTITIMVLDRVLFPMAQEYVKKTDNKWDDKVLEFLEELQIFIVDELDAKKDVLN